MSSGMILAVSGGAALRARSAPSRGAPSRGNRQGEESHPALWLTLGPESLDPGMFGGPPQGPCKVVRYPFLSSRIGFTIALRSAGREPHAPHPAALT